MEQDGTFDGNGICFYWIGIHGGGSKPIIINSNGMNIHLPAILMFTRGTRFWHTATWWNLDGFFFCFWCKLWRRWDVNQWDKTRMFQHLIISYPLFALNNDQWCFIVSKNQLYKLGRAITPAILAPSRPYPILLMFQRCTCLKIWISTAWYRYFVMICDDIPTQRIITIYIHIEYKISYIYILYIYT